MDDRDGNLKVAFIHPDLGIGGAERLVVDAALGLQQLGHEVDIYTSHHDTAHCFEETRDGTLRVHHVKSPFPRAYKGKFHILFAHLRQLHLTLHLLRDRATGYDVFFVDQLSTCVPLIRTFAKKRVVFYCHFPDKLLADGEFVRTKIRRKGGFLKRLYRMPMDWLEEITTGNADVLLANSRFTAEVFNTFFKIPRKPHVVYPGINFSAYAPPTSMDSPELQEIVSNSPTLLSLNRFEKKKNIALGLRAFVLLRSRREKDAARSLPVVDSRLRLVLAGGFDPRLQDNIDTFQELLTIATNAGLDYCISSTLSLSSIIPDHLLSRTYPATHADVIFLLNFSTPQRAALLNSPSTLALLYTPANEHFGIGPVEAMACGLPVLACNSGGPIESVLVSPPEERTGWLCSPDEEQWSRTLSEIIQLPAEERRALGDRAKARAQELFGMEAMALGIQEALYDAVQMGLVENSSYLGDVILAVVISLIAYAIYRLVA
ncbi:ALG2 [Sanghuangporus sanghuang]